MYPTLFQLPVWIPILAGGALLGGLVAKALTRHLAWAIAFAILGGLLAWGAGWIAGAGNASIQVPSYGVMVMLGFVAGVLAAQRRASQAGIDSSLVLDLALWGLLAGLIGARLFFVLENWDRFSPFGEHGVAASLDAFKFWQGGLVFYGAFLATLPVVILICRKSGTPILPFLDLTAPCLVIGLAFGRIGCFLNSCCYGKACSLPWQVHFPEGSDAYRFQLMVAGHLNDVQISPGLHPTQLYAALGATLTASFLYLLWPLRRYPGQVFGLMLVMASATRFFEEFLRADNDAAFPLLSRSWTIAQWIALVLIAGGFALLLYFRSSAAQRSMHVSGASPCSNGNSASNP